MGNFFFNRRKSLGLSQRRIAVLLDMTDAAVGSWERSEVVPRLALAPKLALVYQVSQERIENEIVKLTREIASAEASAAQPA